MGARGPRAQEPGSRPTGEKRVLRSAMSPRFQPSFDRERYTPDETIKGTILVRDGGGSRALEAILEYKEETADYSEVAISIPSGPLHEGELTAGTSFEFELASRRCATELQVAARRALLGARREVRRVRARHPRTPPDRDRQPVLKRAASSEPPVASPALYECAPAPASSPPSTIRYSSRIGLPSNQHSRISRTPAA